MSIVKTNATSAQVVSARSSQRSKYSDEDWRKAQDLVENTPTSLREISTITGIPVSTIESRASRYGWLSKRDLTAVKESTASVKRVIRELAYQINDMHQHTSALLETLQYSHRIKIERGLDGDIRYVNFEDWPDKPANWSELSEEEKEVHRRYISVSRFRLFKEDLKEILELQAANTDFIAKVSKGTLPKLDVDSLDLSRRSGDDTILSTGSIFAPKIVESPKKKNSKALADLIENVDTDEVS